MSSADSIDTAILFEKLIAQQETARYVLDLFVTGMSRHSMAAIDTIKTLCEERLKGRYALTVIDVVQQPEVAREEQLFAAPTLVKRHPMPFRRLIGDLSNRERVLAGLSLSAAG